MVDTKMKDFFERGGYRKVASFGDRKLLKLLDRSPYIIKDYILVARLNVWLKEKLPE